MFRTLTAAFLLAATLTILFSIQSPQRGHNLVAAQDAVPPPSCAELAAEVANLSASLLPLENMLIGASGAVLSASDAFDLEAANYKTAVDLFYSEPPLLSQAQLDASEASYHAALQALQVAWADEDVLQSWLSLDGAARTAAAELYQENCP